MMALAAELAAIATAEGMTPVELAYAWLAQKPEVDSILLGPATVEHLDQAIDALDRTVSPEALQKIEVLYRAFQGTETSYAR
jgi:aryl-alcohol dehydrogenase-like predicted oxidoreductase